MKREYKVIFRWYPKDGFGVTRMEAVVSALNPIQAYDQAREYNANGIQTLEAAYTTIDRLSEHPGKE